MKGPIISCVLLCLSIACSAQSSAFEEVAFHSALKADWREVFHDTCTGDWQDKWFLDGEIASVSNSDKGMQLTAGPQFMNDAHHMVLWTKDSFQGDLMIEFDYTRLDFETRCVNILYIQATGSGAGPFETDIAAWKDARKVPAMSMYFNHMNAYHISFAAFPNQGTDRTQYIRARRYVPEETGLADTDLQPDYYPEGLFAPGDPHRITVFKKARDVYMKISNATQDYYCHFINSELPIIEKGRVGLRLMFTRSALFANFRIFELEE